MNVFDLHGRLIEDCHLYVDSFIQIKDDRIRAKVDEELDNGLLWPDPLVQLNPAFAAGGRIADLVAEKILHPQCEQVFRVDKDGTGKPIALHPHQTEAIRAAASGDDYVLTTGTGSGKSLAHIIPGKPSWRIACWASTTPTITSASGKRSQTGFSRCG